MRVLVIGGNQLAGRMILSYLGQYPEYELYHTLSHQEKRQRGGLFLDASDSAAVDKLVEAVRPDTIVNSLAKLNDQARLQEVTAYRINGLLPHQLAALADQFGARLIQLSTDAVFSGYRGSYEERHVPDGGSVYAKTKALGEVSKAPHLTIRTALIGPEDPLEGIGLFQWFLRQTGTIKGFLHVPWNGITTLELAKFIRFALERPELQGIVHLTSEDRVSKFELLKMLQTIFRKPDVVIEPSDVVVMDRTLRSTRHDLLYSPRTQEVMLRELYDWMEFHHFTWNEMTAE